MRLFVWSTLLVLPTAIAAKKGRSMKSSSSSSKTGAQYAPAPKSFVTVKKKKLQKMKYLMMVMKGKSSPSPIQTPRPTPTTNPTASPTSSPRTVALTSPPAVDCLVMPPPFPSFPCQPTSGTCVSSSTAIVEAMARGDEIVALCGDTTIETSSAIAFTMSFASQTLCCQTQTCVLQSSGSDRNLFVSIQGTGTNLTISNVTFRGGRRPQEDFLRSGRGGNVYIEISEQTSNTQVLIQDCSFDSGVASDSGNLYVDNTFGRVSLIRSTFLKGEAFYSGGGAYIAAGNITIDGTTFAENVVDSTDFGLGGGLVTDYKAATISQEIAIYNSTFFQNVAEQAGGMFTSSLGTLSALHIQQTTFSENRCFAPGCGAAADLFPVASTDLTFCENDGSANSAEGNESCDGILLGGFGGPDPGQCIRVVDDI